MLRVCYWEEVFIAVEGHCVCPLCAIRVKFSCSRGALFVPPVCAIRKWAGRSESCVRSRLSDKAA